MEQVKKREPLPIYSEENEPEFLKMMVQEKLSAHLTNIASSIEGTLSIGVEVSNNLGMDPDELLRFVPNQTEAQECVKTLLSKVSAATCLKILLSKAAENKASTIVESLDNTISFIETNSVELPSSKLMDRMKALRAEISVPAAKKKAASAPAQWMRCMLHASAPVATCYSRCLAQPRIISHCLCHCGLMIYDIY